MKAGLVFPEKSVSNPAHLDNSLTFMVTILHVCYTKL